MDLTPEQQACNQNTTPQQLRALAGQSTQLARLVCTNPNAEPDLLRKNPKTPINLIKIFLEDKNKLVRESALVVYLQSFSEEKDINFNEQLQIAQNINTESDIIDNIATSKWLIIRERVALHENLLLSLETPI